MFLNRTGFDAHPQPFRKIRGGYYTEKHNSRPKMGKFGLVIIAHGTCFFGLSAAREMTDSVYPPLSQCVSSSSLCFLRLLCFRPSFTGLGSHQA
jgi:hypothetical protein